MFRISDGLDESPVLVYRSDLLAEVPTGIDPSIAVRLGFGGGMKSGKSGGLHRFKNQVVKFSMEFQKTLMLRLR